MIQINLRNVMYKCERAFELNDRVFWDAPKIQKQCTGKDKMKSPKINSAKTMRKENSFLVWPLINNTYKLWRKLNCISYISDGLLCVFL